MAVLSLEAVAVELGSTQILAGVDLGVAAGEWVNVIGPNGAGKTTMLRAILGVIDHEGTIDRNGVDVSDPMARARTIAYVPQVPVIPAGVPVADYVLLGRTPHRGVFGADSARDLQVVAGVLDRLDLHGFADRDVGSLSGGERQRVVLARALAQESSVLLLDEPTTALDLGHQQEVLGLVQELREERDLAVLATLHDLTLAGRHGDRIAVLAGGRIVATGHPAEVLTVDLVERHFAARVRIIPDDDGPIIVPSSPRRGSTTDPERSDQ